MIWFEELDKKQKEKYHIMTNKKSYDTSIGRIKEKRIKKLN